MQSIQQYYFRKLSYVACQIVMSTNLNEQAV